MKKHRTRIIAATVALAPFSIAHAADPVVGGDEAGTFKLPGSNTSVGLYGFVRVDLTKDFQAGTKDWAYDGGSVGIRNDPSGINADSRKGKLNATAETSRLGFKTSTPTDVGKACTLIETDFVGGKLRIRHAFGNLSSSWGSVLVGQYFTLFRSLESLPETVDWNGVNSLAGARKPQVRYTTAPGAAGTLAFGIEVPPANPSSDTTIKLPAVTTAWVKDGEQGSVSVRLIANPVSFEKIPNGADTSSKTKYGYGASVAGALKLGGADTLKTILTYGSGISQYVQAAYYNPEVLNGADIALNKLTALAAGWQHRWSPSLRTNLSYGQTWFGSEYADAVNHAANKTVTATFANAIWSPAKNIEFGFELAHANRKLTSGELGRFDRFTATAYYGF